METNMSLVELPTLGEREVKIFKAMKELGERANFSKLTVINFFLKYRSTSGYAQNKFKDPLKKSDRKQYDAYCEKVEGLSEQLESFNNYNSSYRENIISAFLIDKYVYESNISTGDLVFSDSLGLIGFCGEKLENLLTLFSGQSRKSSQLIGTYCVKDFVKVRIIK